MRIHEVKRRGGRIALCCDRFVPSFHSGHFTTEHAEIVTCDDRDLFCPDCQQIATEVIVQAEPPDFTSTEALDGFDLPGSNLWKMKFNPCGHVFWMYINLEMNIRLKRK